MNKLFVGLFLVIALVTFGWSSNVGAAGDSGCANATFNCFDRNNNQLGVVSVTCSLQVPFNDLTPRCMPNWGIKPFASVDECKKTYPKSFRACPNQNWPSGYSFSKCESYPSF
jgi:hypothetical protein